MKTKTFFILFLLFSLVLKGQDIEVKSMKTISESSTNASTRKDINGNVCGLVRVQLKEPDAQFSGNVLGDVAYKNGEYWVYMAMGSKRLNIKHPNYLPVTVVFSSLGLNKVTSGAEYLMTTKLNKAKAPSESGKKGMAVFNIKPSNAILLIDGQKVNGSSGAYTLQLPYGTHYFTVQLNDFSLNNQPLKIDKDAKNINVDLTEFFSKLDVSCATEDATILINQEQKGAGRWGGMVTPGKYTIEAQKDGCHSQTRQIEILDNDNITIAFPALKTITGSLRVDYKPDGSEVRLNDKVVGVTPLEIKELPVGDYQLEIWKEYYTKKSYPLIQIREDQEWTETGELDITLFGKMVAVAEDGEPDAIIDYYQCGAAFGAHGFPYTCSDDTFHVALNPLKAMYWEKSCEKTFPSNITEEEKKLSFVQAKKAVEDYEQNNDDDEWLWYSIANYNRFPYAALAWHYFYGIGCTKNVEEAKRLIRHHCTKEGENKLPALIELIKDMGLESELKYVPDFCAKNIMY